MIALALLTAYLVFTVIRFGWLPSISESYYHVQHRVAFWVAMTGVAFLTLSAREWTYLYFPLASFGLMLVGVAPNFKTKGLANWAHYLGAGLALICGFLGIGFEFGLWWLVVIGLWLIAGCYILLERNILYWVEIVAFYIILITIYVQ